MLDQLLTEPLSVAALARYFGCRRSLMRARLERMAGAERFGNRWRVPVLSMPPAYWLDAGLLQIGPDCTNGLPGSSHDSDN